MKESLKFPIRSLVVRNKPFLKRLFHALKSEDQARLRRIISKANADEIYTICEICQNFLSGNFPKKDRKFIRSLRPYKKILREVACTSNTLGKKKTSLQKGGAFPLLALLTPIIGSLLGSAVSSAI